jgi:hypothetical protein
MGNGKYYMSAEFLRLRKEYYEKLKEDGFKDIEITDWSTGESGNLLRGFGHMDAVRRWTPDKERYYQLARQMAQRLSHRRYDKDERRVWRLHSEGTSFRAIERETGISRGRVSRVVKQIEKEMLDGEKGS